MPERPESNIPIHILDKVEQYLKDPRFTPLTLRQLLHTYISGQEEGPATEDPEKLALMRALIATLDGGIDKKLSPSEIKAKTIETFEELKRHINASSQE